MRRRRSLQTQPDPVIRHELNPAENRASIGVLLWRTRSSRGHPELLQLPLGSQSRRWKELRARRDLKCGAGLGRILTETEHGNGGSSARDVSYGTWWRRGKVYEAMGRLGCWETNRGMARSSSARKLEKQSMAEASVDRQGGSREAWHYYMTYLM